jgi:hypothetical protein
MYSENLVCPGLVKEENESILGLLRRYRQGFKRNDSLPGCPICWVEQREDKKYVVYVWELTDPPFNTPELPKGSYIFSVTGPCEKTSRKLLERIIKTLEINDAFPVPARFRRKFARTFSNIYQRTLDSITA